jgi:hypothetical protein
MNEDSSAEITWEIMDIARKSDGDAVRKSKLTFDDPKIVRWVKFLAQDGLIEIIDCSGLVAIDGITAKGMLILSKAPDRKSWVKIIGPIIASEIQLALI